ncbi:MAG: hypothetical protein EON93_09170 [Burkholderiales bacterium]|nr:MAG: hypothetical protein EON93_09170 [Burkholderiales bacterium]
MTSDKKMRRQYSAAQKARVLAERGGLIALPLPAPTVPGVTAADVRVELRRAPVSITGTWPVSAAAELAAL